jgi:hypothetical protein
VGYLRIVEIALLHSWRWAATLGAEGAKRRAVARSSVIAQPLAWPRADASATQYDGGHNTARVVGLALLALVLPLGRGTR